MNLLSQNSLTSAMPAHFISSISLYANVRRTISATVKNVFSDFFQKKIKSELMYIFHIGPYCLPYLYSIIALKVKSDSVFVYYFSLIHKSNAFQTFIFAPVMHHTSSYLIHWQWVNMIEKLHSKCGFLHWTNVLELHVIHDAIMNLRKWLRSFLFNSV